jgi:hypothetical protein
MLASTFTLPEPTVATLAPVAADDRSAGIAAGNHSD